MFLPPRSMYPDRKVKYSNKAFRLDTTINCACSRKLRDPLKMTSIHVIDMYVSYELGVHAIAIAITQLYFMCLRDIYKNWLTRLTCII